MFNLRDVTAERGIISGIFQYHSEGYFDVSDILKPTTFTIEIHQVLYKILQHIFQKNANTEIDLPTIYSAANELKLYEILITNENRKTVTDLSNGIPYIAKDNIRKLAETIRRLEFARQLRNELSIVTKNLDKVTGTENLNSILGVVEKPIYDFIDNIGNEDRDQTILISKDIDKYIDFLKKNPNRKLGIPIGFPKFEYFVGNLRRQTLHVIGARTGVGKSFLAANICLNVSAKNIPVLYLDTEMSSEQHFNRILGILSGASIEDIEAGRLNKIKGLDGVVKIFKGLPFHYHAIQGKEIEEVLSIIKRWLNKTVQYTGGKVNNCLVIYDWLKLANPSNESLKEYELIGYMVSNLQNFCAINDIPILSFIQLNRDGISKDTLSAISQSDRVSWFGSSVSIFRDKSDEEIKMYNVDDPKIFDLYGNKSLYILKSRHGKGLRYGNYINVHMNELNGKIIEKGLKSEIDRYLASQ